ncbi:unnamed protein product [[Actinomadura] parvosata subsp. kistnae]|nr:unnamed protein product [Actinomadura parvosata subsp. kistnae]
MVVVRSVDDGYSLVLTPHLRSRRPHEPRRHPDEGECRNQGGHTLHAVSLLSTPERSLRRVNARTC